MEIDKTWDDLRTDYTDATYEGPKKYKQINHGKDIVSFEDVTQYKNQETSFFGAKQANDMNKALNAITDAFTKDNKENLHKEFQKYFDTQKEKFNQQCSQRNDEITKYLDNLKKTSENKCKSIESNLETENNKKFNCWFDTLKTNLSKDTAINLQNQIIEIIDAFLINCFTFPLFIDDINDKEGSILIDDLGNPILVDWKYKEV